MATICEACGYQRKPTDQAPDWECPSCGKAYVKTAHDVHASSASYAPSLALESGNGHDRNPAYTQASADTVFSETGETKNRNGVIVGVIVAALLIFGIPILSNPSSASAVLLHGNAGFMGLFALVLIGLVFAAKRLGADVDVNDPKSKFIFLVKCLGLFCTVLFLATAVWARHEEHVQMEIQTHGQRIMADVVRIYTGSCGKHSCSIDVEYAFTPTSETTAGSQPVHGYDQLGSSNRPNDPNIEFAKANQRVPVAYDVDRPEVSALNFNDAIFRTDHGERYRSLIGMVAGMCLAVFLIGLAVGGIRYGFNTGNTR